GAFMLTYSLTLAAAAEILKAHVSVTDSVIAFALFALASVTTIVAPVIVALTAPERAEERLAAWRRWLLRNSRMIGLIALIVVGAALIVRGAHDLIAWGVVGGQLEGQTGRFRGQAGRCRRTGVRWEEVAETLSRVAQPPKRRVSPARLSPLFALEP